MLRTFCDSASSALAFVSRVTRPRAPAASIVHEATHNEEQQDTLRLHDGVDRERAAESPNLRTCRSHATSRSGTIRRVFS
jgi:hypothetical protein